jgi:hypothetical protein
MDNQIIVGGNIVNGRSEPLVTQLDLSPSRQLEMMKLVTLAPNQPLPIFRGGKQSGADFAAVRCAVETPDYLQALSHRQRIDVSSPGTHRRIVIS